MIELLAAVLSGSRASGAQPRRLAIRLLAYGAVSLLVLAMIGFLIAALYETFFLMTDRVAAPLLVAATLAAAAAVVLIVMWVTRNRPIEANGREAGSEREEDDIVSFVGQMGAAISNERMPPLTAIGLALAAGLARGMSK